MVVANIECGVWIHRARGAHSLKVCRGPYALELLKVYLGVLPILPKFKMVDA